jgi:hypothetical protein
VDEKPAVAVDRWEEKNAEREEGGDCKSLKGVSSEEDT